MLAKELKMKQKNKKMLENSLTYKSTTRAGKYKIKAGEGIVRADQIF